MSSSIGLIGLGVMGQNLAMNIAEKGFRISVYNRTTSKVDDTIARARSELATPDLHANMVGCHTMEDFVKSLARPRKVIMLVTAGKPVDATIDHLEQLLESGDIIIDGGNEWYENTDRRSKKVGARGILYVGMGVSGGEEGARYGPSLMPGGPREAYEQLEPILMKIAAKSDSGPCVTYLGPGGSGNYVKMIHNGIEYGDMQLIAEVYDLMRKLGHLSNDEIQQSFNAWNQGELKSFLVEITSIILGKKDDKQGADGHLVDKVLDKSGSKGTGMWTVQEAASRGIAAPTIAAALDSRYISSLKDERTQASKKLAVTSDVDASAAVKDKSKFVEDLRHALYASKICSYTQGMNIIKQASKEFNWNLDLGEIARIWKAGCIIRAVFLDRITRAFKKNPQLNSLLMDDEFAAEINERQAAWRRVVCLAIQHGVPVPALSSSLAYFDSYRSERLPANLIQSQRDFFGAHTYQRVDEGLNGPFHHSEWGTTSYAPQQQ